MIRTRGISPDMPTNATIHQHAVDLGIRFDKLVAELRYYKWPEEEISQAVLAAQKEGKDRAFLDALAKFVHQAAERKRPFK